MIKVWSSWLKYLSSWLKPVCSNVLRWFQACCCAWCDEYVPVATLFILSMCLQMNPIAKGGISYPPKEITCHLKRDHFKRKVVFQPLFFLGYVSFRGSNFKLEGSLKLFVSLECAFFILLWGSIEQPHLLEDLVEVHQQPDRYRAGCP